MGKRGASSSVENNKNKSQKKVDNRKIYSIMMQEPGYRNGGTNVMLKLYKTLEEAKDCKTKWVSGWGKGYYDFSGENVDESDKEGELPKYDHDSLSFGGECGEDYIYCTIEEIDLDGPGRKDGSLFFTSMNA